MLKKAKEVKAWLEKSLSDGTIVRITSESPWSFSCIYSEEPLRGIRIKLEYGELVKMDEERTRTTAIFINNAIKRYQV